MPPADTAAPPPAAAPDAVRLRLLRDALLACFDEHSLREFVGFDLADLDRRLRTEVNYLAPLAAVTFDLVTKAQALGVEADVVGKLLAARPRKAEVQALRGPFGRAAGRDGGGGDGGRYPPVVQDAAVRFNERFTSRRRLLAILQTNKGLHDILHQLDKTRPEIARLLAAAAAAGYDAWAAVDLLDVVAKWKEQAGDYVFAAHRTDPRRRWVLDLTRAADVVAARLGGTAVPAADLDRAVAKLANLPTDQQPDLNARLRDTAGDLDTAGLAAPLADLRAALGGGDAARLDAAYNRFDASCTDLKDLIAQHDFCQLVDGALWEANGLPGVTAAGLSQWAEVADWLRGLAGCRPSDTAARRLVETADRFAAAAPAAAPAALVALRERFGNVFFEIDAELLDATVSVLQTAEVLDALLTRFLP